MNGRILAAIVITLAVYIAYSWWSLNKTEGFDINSQTYMPAEPQLPPVEAPLTRIVSPGGPSSPNQLSQKPPVIMPEEAPYDPQDKPYESSELPERLRHPERMFGPGLVNDETQSSVESGIASKAQQITQQSYQEFGPEFAQNGGTFLDNGVIANDSTLPTSYSSV
jgi:hypothetical protein